MMNAQEIETALRCETPIVVLIWNDSQYGLINWKQKRRYGRSAYIDFKTRISSNTPNPSAPPACASKLPTNCFRH